MLKAFEHSQFLNIKYFILKNVLFFTILVGKHLCLPTWRIVKTNKLITIEDKLVIVSYILYGLFSCFIYQVRYSDALPFQISDSQIEN